MARYELHRFEGTPLYLIHDTENNITHTYSDWYGILEIKGNSEVYVGTYFGNEGDTNPDREEFDSLIELLEDIIFDGTTKGEDGYYYVRGEGGYNEPQFQKRYGFQIIDGTLYNITSEFPKNIWTTHNIGIVHFDSIMVLQTMEQFHTEKSRYNEGELANETSYAFGNKLIRIF